MGVDEVDVTTGHPCSRDPLQGRNSANFGAAVGGTSNRQRPRKRFDAFRPLMVT